MPKSITETMLVEPYTNQQVYPLNWDEDEQWVEVYVQGERVRFQVDELRTPSGENAFVPVHSNR